MSYFTYAHNYMHPSALFWDENYHIASAQKYLHGVHYMEMHPPLGKLLIAAGEALLRPNETSDFFADTNYGTGEKMPDNMSFAGYRLFPTIFAWMTALVMFGIFLTLTGNPLIATLLSFLYIFDNALIVHQRSAMLDAPLLFFFSLSILSFLLLLKHRKNPKVFLWLSMLFGLSFAGLATVKVSGLITALLVPALVWLMRDNLKLVGKGALCGAAVFLITYVGVWQLHFALAHTPHPDLDDEGYFKASDTYKALIDEGKTANILYFPVMWRDSIRYFTEYQEGVPSLDLCKEGETGSNPLLWPLGARSINYRWETPEGTNYRYLYLQSNPVVWFAGVAGVLLALVLTIGSCILPVKNSLKRPVVLAVLLAMYGGYMFVMLNIDRVMYLYHYFPPLILSFVLLGVCLDEITHVCGVKLDEQKKLYGLMALCTLMVVSFQFFRPLTYYAPLSDDQLKRRSLLKIWDLKCVNCDRNNGFTIRSC